LTKPINLLEYLRATGEAVDGPTGENAEEVAGNVRSGTRTPGRDEAVAGAGPAGTLLAVVPIPGTGTSLAIVGYPVPGPGGAVGVGASVQAGLFPSNSGLAGTAPAGIVLAAQPDGGHDGLLLDHDQRRVWADGAEIALTFQEFELLAFLTAHPDTVFSRADLVRAAWQREFAEDSRTVDVHVSRLRHKLGRFYGSCLVTEYRVGYQFRPGG